MGVGFGGYPQQLTTTTTSPSTTTPNPHPQPPPHTTWSASNIIEPPRSDFFLENVGEGEAKAEAVRPTAPVVGSSPASPSHHITSHQITTGQKNQSSGLRSPATSRFRSPLPDSGEDDNRSLFSLPRSRPRVVSSFFLPSFLPFFLLFCGFFVVIFFQFYSSFRTY